MVLYFLGFRLRRDQQHQQHQQTQAVYCRRSNIKYSSSSRKPLPIVFIHGIGIGFAHYLRLVLNFPRNTDVYLIEWPHVAMQLQSTVPTSEQVVQELIQLVISEGHQTACFVAHSLGTTAISWLLHHPEGMKIVGASVLLDPVTFLLCDPTVATKFVYKDPTTTLDFMMHFFVSRELFIANSLSRHFSWSENILFVEELEYASSFQGATGVQHTIVISTEDTIIPVAPVMRYLANKAKSLTGSSKYGTSFEILYFEGLLHGEMFLYPKHIRNVIDKISLRCGLAVGEHQQQ
jgi:pimeloyl-ACP methyl ester carboxylesterase